MLADQETHDLQLRVLDLKVRIEVESRVQALGDLLDRIVVFLKKAHGESFPTFERVEHAAEEALQP